jgi:transposase
MFVKVTPRKKGGKTYYFAELVEAYREQGNVRHRRILYFGSVDQDTARRLKIAFSRDFDSFTNIDKVDFSAAVPYGNFFLIESLLSRLEMFEYFSSKFVSADPHITVPTAAGYIKAMLFQRIVQPDSKLALLEWLPLTPLKHFLGIEKLDLQSLYRSLEVLQENFSVVEQYLYDMAVKEFNQDDKELYYDLTSSYFEGHRCIIAEYGYSRDRRKDRKQIVIGLVTTSDGFPIKCKVYPGNRVDKTTVKEVLAELKQEYPIEEIIFVGDRGMLTADNISAIEQLEQKYVMAIPRAWSKKYIKDIAIDENAMRKIKEDLYAVFLPSSENQRLLLCLNTQKREDDRKYRTLCITIIKEELDKLNASLGKNKNITTRDEAMKRAGLILKLNFARKYFTVKTVDSSINELGFEIHYELKTAKIQSDEKLDGTFVILSNEETYDDEKLIKIYKNLSKVENAFKVLKNDLDIRPVNHRKEIRVEGHVYVCVLAYFIIAAIEYIAMDKKLNKSARKILRQLSQISLLEINLPDGKKKYSITTVQKEHKKILDAYKIKKIKVPDVV